MSAYKHALFLLVLPALLLVANAHAQKPPDEYTIQFFGSAEGVSPVKHDSFPNTEIKFVILKNGVPEQKPWPRDRIRLLEDGREVPHTSRSESMPVDVTVVYHFLEYWDATTGQPYGRTLPNNPNPGPGILAEIESQVQELGTVRLRSLCLTKIYANSPQPCGAIDTATDSRLDGSNDTNIDKGTPLTTAFVNRADYSISDNTNSVKSVEYQVIWDSILADRVPGRYQQVLWLLDDDILQHDTAPKDLLPVDESQLIRLQETGVSLIFVDLTAGDDIQTDDRWTTLLGMFDIQYLRRDSSNSFQNQGCGDFWNCMIDAMLSQHSHLHTVTYTSNLFVDTKSHSVRVQLLDENAEMVVAQEAIDFVISPPHQAQEATLRSYVRWFRQVFNFLAFIILLSVLILIRRPQDSAVSHTPGDWT